mmetsp:Transcript_28319/g.27254  ORF Transcript_28319/g.27254 Transcript_28319/m.27254 type:complete len:104 (+) Transcript_28319:1267-1578(+)
MNFEGIQKSNKSLQTGNQGDQSENDISKSTIHEEDLKNHYNLIALGNQKISYQPSVDDDEEEDDDRSSLQNQLTMKNYPECNERQIDDIRKIIKYEEYQYQSN